MADRKSIFSEEDLNRISENVSRALTGGLVPLGSVLLNARKNVANGWAVCDGSELSRNDYARLFQAIGTTFGAGNGTTTFNLPNLPSTIEGMQYVISTGLPNNDAD